MNLQTASVLVGLKYNDHLHNAATMPPKTRALSKIFARTLGLSAGILLDVYCAIITDLVAGKSEATVLRKAHHVIDRQSKLAFTTPCGVRRARLCGLVALNHSGYTTADVKLTARLLRDLEHAPQEAPINEQISYVATQHPHVYRQLLDAKHTAIDRYAIMMGIRYNPDYLSAITGAMPPRLAHYYTIVVKLHGQNALGICSPLPFKKFARVIERGLRGDTVSYQLQKAIGGPYGFEDPSLRSTNERLDLLRALARSIATQPGLIGKWRAATILPTATFYLSGFQAYAEDAQKKKQEPSNAHATTSARLLASSSADDEDDFIVLSTLFFTTTRWRA